MSANSEPNVMTRSGGSGPTAAVEKYHRDFFYLGKGLLRLGICIFVVTLIARLAFSDVSPILVIVLCVISVVFMSIGLIRICFSYNALKNTQNNSNNSDSSTNSMGISTISNFRAFIQNNSRQTPRNSLEAQNRVIPESIHCGNRTFGSPTLVAPPIYEPPPSYEQIQKESQNLQIKT